VNHETDWKPMKRDLNWGNMIVFLCLEPCIQMHTNLSLTFVRPGI